MKKLYAVIILALAGVSLPAQSDLLLYHFNAVPQSLTTNPAMPQQSRLWVAIPGISGVSSYYHNSAFSLADLLAKGTDVNQNLKEVIDRMGPQSHLATHSRIDLIGVAFKSRNAMWSFGVQEIVDFKIDFNRELFRFLYYGNTEPDTRVTDVSNLDAEFSSRAQFYLGYQRSLLNDNLRLGGRLKYLRGQQHAYAERMNIRISTTDSSTLQANSDVLLRTSGLSQLLGGGDFNAMDAAMPANTGFAVDLGLWYRLSDKMSISASVLDMGAINWQTNNRDYISKGDFHYEGLNADLSDEEPVEDEQAVLDSLKAAFNFEEVDGQAYSRGLSSQFYLGGEYQLSKRHSLSALYHARIWEGEWYHDMNLSYSARLSNIFQFTTGYSFINGTSHNVGLGFDLKLGPMQLYLITDNLVNAIYYEDLQSSNVNVGLNISLYDRKNKKTSAESPEVNPVEIPNTENDNSN